MTRRYFLGGLLSGVLALSLAGCFPGAGTAANAVKGALAQQAAPQQITVQPPKVEITFEDITFQQVPTMAGLQTLDDDDAADTEAQEGQPGDLHPILPQAGPCPQGDAAEGQPCEEATHPFHPGYVPTELTDPDLVDQAAPDTFDRAAIRDALGPVFRDLDDRLQDLDNRLSSMEGS